MGGTAQAYQSGPNAAVSYQAVQVQIEPLWQRLFASMLQTLSRSARIMKFNRRTDGSRDANREKLPNGFAPTVSCPSLKRL